jgi:hypothetical protein
MSRLPLPFVSLHDEIAVEAIDAPVDARRWLNRDSANRASPPPIRSILNENSLSFDRLLTSNSRWKAY